MTVVPPACATIHPELESIALAYLERVVGVRLADVPDAFTDGQDAGRPRSEPFWGDE